MSAGPQQGGAQHQERHSFLLDAFCLGLGGLFCILSAAPYLGDHCRGHAGAGLTRLPPDYASVLRLYPCNGSAAARASFLAQYCITIVKELLSFRGPEGPLWLAALLSFWLLLVASRICLPPRMYSHLAAPFLTCAARALPLVLFLAAGPKTPLSSAAFQFLFRSQGFLDVIVNIMHPSCVTPVEIIYGAFSVMATGVLTSWHGNRNNHGSHPALGGGGGRGSGVNGGGGGGGASDTSARVFMAQVVLQRAAMLFAVYWLTGRCLHRRHPSSSRGRRRYGAGGGFWPLRVPASTPPPPLVQQQQEQPQRPPPPPSPPQQPQQEQEGLSAAAATSAVTYLKTHQMARGAEDPLPPPPPPLRHDRRRIHGACPKTRMESQAASDAAAAATAASAPAATWPAVQGIPSSDPDAAAAAAAAAAAVLGFGAPYGGSPLPYKSPIRRHTARFKIPFAEPDQLSPGYVERLQDLARQRGMVLSGVYVRQGCIELLLDLEQQPDILYDFCTSVAYGTAGPRAGGSEGRQEDFGFDSVAADVAGVLAALGIAAPADERLGQAAVRVAVVPLGQDEKPVEEVASYGSGEGGGGGGGGGEQRPRVLELSPRILLAAPPAVKGGVREPRASAAAARLSVVASYPAGFAAGGLQSSSTAAAAPPPPPPSPEVLVRFQGVYLQSVVTLRRGGGGGDGGGDGGGGGADADVACTFDVELLELPAAPGAVLVEFRWGGELSRAVPILVLHDAAVAAELQSAVAARQQSVAAAAAAAGGGNTATYDYAFDGLILDLGAWMTESAAAASAAPARMPYPAAEAHLAAHLHRHAVACGWTATANLIRADLDRIRQLDVAATGSVAAAPPPPAAAVATGAGSELEASLAAPPPPPPPAAAAVPGGGAARAAVAVATAPPAPHALLLTALLQALGWSVFPPKEEAAYQAYAAPRVLSYSHVIQAVEVMSLLALLFRARQQLLDPGNLTTLAGCAVGTTTAVAWLLLPRRRWEQLVNAAKVPRYVAYMTAKLMIGWLGFPAPPAIVPYQLGPAMLIMEGVLLPFSSLLPPRTALLLALIKWPLGVAMMLRCGATADPSRATLLCLRVVLAAAATTVACHTYLRYGYAAWAAAKATEAAAVAVAAGGRQQQQQQRQRQQGKEGKEEELGREVVGREVVAGGVAGTSGGGVGGGGGSGWGGNRKAD